MHLKNNNKKSSWHPQLAMPGVKGALENFPPAGKSSGGWGAELVPRLHLNPQAAGEKVLPPTLKLESQILDVVPPKGTVVLLRVVFIQP